MTATQALFDRITTPIRMSLQTKPNKYWVGDNHDQLAIPINYWVEQFLGCFDLENDVEEIHLFGRLLELRGSPTYRGADPEKVHLYVHTKSATGEYEKVLDNTLFGEHRASPCGLEFRVSLFPAPIHKYDELDWVADTMQLYPPLPNQ